MSIDTIPYGVRADSAKHMHDAALLYVDAAMVDLLPDIVHHHPEKKIVVCMKDISDRNKDLVHRLLPTGNIFCETFEKNFRYGYPQDTCYPVPVSSFYQLEPLVRLGVAYVYISGDLLFNLKELTTLREKYGKKTTFLFDPTNSMSLLEYELGCDESKGEFVRPEDVHLYVEGGCIPFFKTKNDTVVKVYKRQDWRGELGIVINNLYSHAAGYALNKALPDEFGEKRSNCGRRCMRLQHGCHFCSSCFYFAATIKRHVAEFTEDN